MGLKTAITPLPSVPLTPCVSKCRRMVVVGGGGGWERRRVVRERDKQVEGGIVWMEDEVGVKVVVMKPNMFGYVNVGVYCWACIVGRVVLGV
mmetsp:Transcript_752/g.1235  ORF Transcript_752/g.1235 Transcript_752/m.1235 type:complete len:92 (+) Transcript_752:687-962(+)